MPQPPTSPARGAKRLVSIAFLLLAAGSSPPPAAAQSADAPGLQVIAGERAAAAVESRSPEELLAPYPELREFVYDGDEPFGSLHPAAPPETRQYGRLAGIWYTETQALFQGRWYCCWNAMWGFRYVINGFAVQDLYYQLQEDLPPVAPVKDRDTALTQLRVYQPDVREWSVAYVTSGGAENPAGNHGRFRSFAEGDAMVMEPPPPDDPAAPLRRIVFFDIGEDRFSWRRETSEDGGDTWQVQVRIEARRVPVGAGGAP